MFEETVALKIGDWPKLTVEAAGVTTVEVAGTTLRVLFAEVDAANFGLPLYWAAIV